MPDRDDLQIGDSIRILYVPPADLQQRANGVPRQAGDILPTASVIELIIAQCPVVIIDAIDEYGQPWFSVNLRVGEDIEHHSLVVTKDESWEIVYQKSNDEAPPKVHLIAQLGKDIDYILDEFSVEYQSLAERSEKLYDQQQVFESMLEKDPATELALKQERKSLREAYKDLNEKTGLQALFTKVAQLKEPDK